MTALAERDQAVDGLPPVDMRNDYELIAFFRRTTPHPCFANANMFVNLASGPSRG